MISQIASVFSSQGVVLQETERIAVPRNDDEASQSNPLPEQADSGEVFDQAAAKLELSSMAAKMVSGSGRTLSPEQLDQLAKLKERDREVRAHEEQHAARAGSYAKGGPQYEYKMGPDGKQYAVSGRVNVDTSPVQGNPRATLQKARILRQVAQAPAKPSDADRAVAAQAARMALDAARQLAEERRRGGVETTLGRPHPYARTTPASGQFLDISA